ncbi:hypothetical protein CC2G_008246 [Coprinopsis cinerea AmutBmut pab1-1]|nr:hypothetical protein CC2G_008246 [Coprinopsis cinerea AmutBmut pab1-1]
MPATEDPEVVSYSLEEFCYAAGELLDRPGESFTFAQFALSGFDQRNGRQSSIDPYLNHLSQQEDIDLTCTRDIDSVIGLSTRIELRGADLTIFPIPRYHDTLKKNVKVTYSVLDSEGGTRTVELHKIPNVGIGKFGTHTLIRLMFPNAPRDTPTSPLWALSVKCQAELYQLGIRPVLRKLMESRGANLPASREAELFRARTESGQLALGSRKIPEFVVEQFSDVLRETLEENNVEWAKDFFFMHEIRGDQRFDLSLSSRLPPRSGGFGEDAFEPPPRPQSPSLGLSRRLPVASPLAAAKSVTQLSSGKYYVDLASHLTAVAGFRVTPGPTQRGAYELHYWQAYHTDKSHTYQPENHRFGKHVSGYQVTHGKANSFFDGTYGVYRRCAEDCPSNLRMEGRVPLRHAAAFMVAIDADVLFSSAFGFSCWAWWGFKAYRVLSLKLLYEWQLEGPPHLRTQESALLLAAATALLASSIHSTIDTRPASRELMAAIFPLAERFAIFDHHLPFPISLDGGASGSPEELDESEDSGGQREATQLQHPAHTDLDDEEIAQELSTVPRASDLVPHAPFGALFTRPLRYPQPPVPRFEWRRIVLTDYAFKVMFGQARHELHDDILGSNIAYARNPNRVSNRRKQPLAPQVAPIPKFALEDAGFHIQPAATDDGSDVETRSDDEFESEDPLDKGLDEALGQLWNQSFVDFAGTMPNRTATAKNGMNHGPYTVLSEEERTTITSEQFRNLNLSDTFEDVQWRHAKDEKEWREVFDRLWPAKGRRKIGKTQNYSKTRYYPSWVEMSERLTPDAAEAARAELWSLFKRLRWVPLAKADRIWETRATPGTFKRPPGADPSQPAPKILVVPRGKPTWDGNHVEGWGAL